ncbi:TRAP transporter substrate-binding protein DctP [bacterium]|nr:TRAP transporter substrate-binding protein DctP [bacterium]
MHKSNIVFIVLIMIMISSVSEATQVIKFATIPPEGSTWLKIMHEYADAVEKATAGQVSFKIYAGGVAGDEKDVIRKIRFDQYQSGGFTGVGLGEILPMVRVLDTPMLFNDYAEVDYIYDQMSAEFEKGLEQKGYILVGWTQVGFIHLFSNKHIQSMSDLKSTRMWMWEGDPVAAATIKSLGVSPVPLPVTDVLTSLQTNLIDTVYTNPLACVSLQWFTKLKWISTISLTHASGAVLVSKTMFNRLSAEQQNIVRTLGREYCRKLVLQSRKDDHAALELMKKNGLHSFAFEPVQDAMFREACRNARQALVDNLYPQSLLDRIEQALARYRVGDK